MEVYGGGKKKKKNNETQHYTTHQQTTNKAVMADRLWSTGQCARSRESAFRHKPRCPEGPRGLKMRKHEDARRDEADGGEEINAHKHASSYNNLTAGQWQP